MSVKACRAQFAARQQQKVLGSLRRDLVLEAHNLNASRERPALHAQLLRCAAPQLVLNEPPGQRRDAKTRAYQALDRIGSPDVHEGPHLDSIPF